MKSVFTKILAIVGTVLVWFPIVATIVLSMIGSIMRRMFRFDYLMPAELFPAALLGGVLLIWAAFLAHERQGLIGWSLVAAIVLLVGGQILAVATGLASGLREPTDWAWVVVLITIAAYSLDLMLIGTGGILLVRDLFTSARSSPTTS